MGQRLAPLSFPGVERDDVHGFSERGDGEASPELAAKQQQAAVAAQNMYEALQRKERAAAIEIESIAGQMRTLLAKIEADPPKSTAAVNKWWEILCDSSVLDR